MERKLAGKVAVVTGAARGLGRATALRLAALGANVVVNDIDLAAAKEFNEELTADTVMDECRALGVESLGIQADMTKKEQVDALVQQTVKEFGGIDVLVNIAGGMLRPVERSYPTTMDLDDMKFIMDVNLMSAIYACMAVVPIMKERGGGRIVNASSTSAFNGSPRMASYGVSKAAVLRYTRSLASEVGEFGINVNAIAPAVITTSRTMSQFPDRWDIAERVPLRRLGTPEEVAKVVEFLCTDLSDYVTGQCIVICGGLYLGFS